MKSTTPTSGRLDRVGDAYLSEERAFELLGVKQVHDDAFMRGQSQADGVARTLDEVAVYRALRDSAKAEADALRAESERLIAEANRIEGR